MGTLRRLSSLIIIRKNSFFKFRIRTNSKFRTCFIKFEKRIFECIRPSLFGTDNYFTSSASSRSKSILRREEQSQVGLKLDDRKNLKMPTCLILLIDKKCKNKFEYAYTDRFEISRPRSRGPLFSRRFF